MKEKVNFKLKDEKKLNFSDIIQYPNDMLRQISTDIAYPLNKKNMLVMRSMIDYVRRSQETGNIDKDMKPAYGISGVQIGKLLKLMFVRIKSEFDDSYEEFALINPNIISRSNNVAYLDTGEGCLSVKGDHEGYIYRSYSIKMSAIDFFTGNDIEISAKGLKSIVLQHEFDHLLGILYFDRINKLNPFEIRENSIKISPE